MRNPLLWLAGSFAAQVGVTWLGMESLRHLVGPSVTASFDAPVVQYFWAHRVDWMTTAMRDH